MAWRPQFRCSGWNFYSSNQAESENDTQIGVIWESDKKFIWRDGMKIQLKRAYEPAEATDGFRIYVDRLWPRGLSHETFHYDIWDKEIAPSNDLRHWFHADPQNLWSGFEEKYREELEQNPGVERLKNLIKTKETVTLLYSSHDHIHNNAAVLKAFLEGSAEAQQS